METKTPNLTLIQGGKKESNRFRVPAILTLMFVVGTLLLIMLWRFE